jgi:hypothetical protein
MRDAVVQEVTAERCANIGRHKKLVKQKILSTSQIVYSHLLALFVHGRGRPSTAYQQEGYI